MIIFMNIMAEKTLDKIKTIEDKAAHTVSQARRDVSLGLIRIREKHARELQTAEEAATKEVKGLLLHAENDAKKEASHIESAAQKEIEEIKKKARPRVEAVKKEILRWLS